ncbi:MAG TPA: helix-turn-helix transcriptional regulator [Ktedonobacteraceae bacterium]|nr:helix-turn-helix transcriptional regulator [Ktedonobacteraceae bacterium]
METPSWTNKVFGEQLRRVRKAALMTQEELAFRAELDRTYISLLERGIKSPTLTTFFRLCRVLDQKPDVFIAQIYEQMTRFEQEQSQTTPTVES